MARDYMANPFDRIHDVERHSIWRILVEIESEAFALGEWNAVEHHFDASAFEGIRAMHSHNPDQWKIVFPSLSAYRDSWMEASREWRRKKFIGYTQREALYARTRLTQIDIVGTRALAHKKLIGDLKLDDGSVLSGARQTLYRLQKQHGDWKVVGFIGHLPLDQGR